MKLSCYIFFGELGVNFLYIRSLTYGLKHTNYVCIDNKGINPLASQWAVVWSVFSRRLRLSP
ncbi:MAG: hypothetical protein LBT29_00775 [Flavobacteriaceae bacterium]|nr:hypothetical protein [Flavobacteriaceae bacterium]